MRGRGRHKGKRLRPIPRNRNRSYDDSRVRSDRSENSYALLSECEDTPAKLQDAVPKTTTTKNSTSATVTNKVPPIVVKSSSVHFVHKRVIEAGVVRYSTKQTNNGTNVQVTNTSDYRSVIKHLQNSNVAYHTYQLDEEKSTKIVLYGLHDLPTDEVMEILKEENLQPTSIKKLQIRQKRYDDQAVYLLHFPAGTISMNLLRTIPALDHCVVKWSYFSKRAGPMQCKRCQLYGHGANNCNRVARCNKCADDHNSSVCPLTAGSSSSDGKVPEHKLKCANCGGNHTATFSGCPKRPAANLPKEPKRTTSFNMEKNSFPALPQTKTIQGWKQLEQNPVKFVNFRQNETASGELFNSSEIIPIVGEVFQKLQKCKTKQDQITVIFEVVAKFCFP